MHKELLLLTLKRASFPNRLFPAVLSRETCGFWLHEYTVAILHDAKVRFGISRFSSIKQVKIRSHEHTKNFFVPQQKRTSFLKILVPAFLSSLRLSVDQHAWLQSLVCDCITDLASEIQLSRCCFVIKLLDLPRVHSFWSLRMTSPCVWLCKYDILHYTQAVKTSSA